MVYMGPFGGIIGGSIGSHLGSAFSDLVQGSCKGLKGHAHHKCRKRKEASRNEASALGGALGGAAGVAFEPFLTGGKVKGKIGVPKKAIVHGGEYVLPANAKPTAAQKKIVAKNKAKAKAKKPTKPKKPPVKKKKKGGKKGGGK